MLRHLPPALLVLSCMATLACGDKLNPAPDPGSCDMSINVSYNHQVRPILGGYCTSCHSAGIPNRNGAPATVNLDTYDDAAAHAERANIRVQAGTMPPSANTAVSAPEKCTFQAWVDQGATHN